MAKTLPLVLNTALGCRPREAELGFPIGTFRPVNEIYLSPRRQCYFTLFDFTEATNYKTFNEF